MGLFCGVFGAEDVAMTDDERAAAGVRFQGHAAEFWSAADEVRGLMIDRGEPAALVAALERASAHAAAAAREARSIA